MPVVGASGAVAAVLGGYAITFPTAKVRTLIFFILIAIVDLPALVLLGIWFVLQMVSGLMGLWGVVLEPVAFWAHIGGFVAGMILMPLLLARRIAAGEGLAERIRRDVPLRRPDDSGSVGQSRSARDQYVYDQR